MVSAATTQTSAGKRHISGVDLALTEPIDRVKHFLSFGRAGDYEVLPPSLSSPPTTTTNPTSRASTST